MEGKISLANFIQEVKKELVDAQDTSGKPFYELESVELEVAFTLEVSGKGKANFVVFDLAGETSGTQLHKVKLNFKPIPPEKGDPASQKKVQGFDFKSDSKKSVGPVYGKSPKL